MDAYHFTEMPYPHIPPHEQISSMRVNLPNKHFDPKIGRELYHRYLDEFQLADELGLDIMLNEHHSSVVCIDVAAPLSAAILARSTKSARILILGNPIANRRQPVRVAEEMAMIDVLSRGRLEAGFVRGVPYEILPANSNPVRMNERHWEALDLIIKCWTDHDGPFSHEGRFFHHRCVNIWPRPMQQPHPPVWVSTTSPGGAAQVGARGFVQATFLTGFDTTKRIYEAYRRGWREAGRGHEIPIDRLAYAALVYVGDTERRARAGAEKLLWYVTSNKVPPHFANPPGYLPVAMNVQLARGAYNVVSAYGTKQSTVEGAIEAGTLFAGTPDQVFQQIKSHWEYVGGYGHLLIMGQAGFLEHDDTVHGIRMFAREVYPRLKQFSPDGLPSGTFE